MFHSYMFLQGEENKIPMHLIRDRLQPGTDKFCIQVRYHKVPLNDLLNNHISDLLVGTTAATSVYLIDRTKIFSLVEGPIVLSRLLMHAGVLTGSNVMRHMIRDIVAYARVLVDRVEGWEEPEEGKVYQPILPIVLGIVEGYNNGTYHIGPPPLPHNGQLPGGNRNMRRIIRI